jgi:23S rRNA (cytosine1962-C5)-methyltransferase
MAPADSSTATATATATGTGADTDNYGTVTLRPGRERSLQRLHPWVFDGAIARVDGNPQAGATVQVRSADRSLLGLGAFSPASKIRVRMWTFSEPSGRPARRTEPAVQRIDAAAIIERIHAAAARRLPLLDGPQSAARLVFSEADGVPGLIADRYADTVVAQLTTAGADAWRATITEALKSLPGVVRVIERSDADSRQREGLPERIGLLAGPPLDAPLIIEEGGLRFAVDPMGGHKTGFYLDQRDARRQIARLASSRRMLNVFAYTGSMSVIAAAHGAASVETVDSSGPALEVARHNAALNGVDLDGGAHTIVEADAFTHLRGLRDRAREYDLIVLDPPKFASSEAQLQKASRAYKDLNLLALKLLAPGGTLLTFSCSGAMGMDLFQKVVAGAALDSGRDAAIVGRLHQPDDHPVPLSFPEAEYLKGLIVERR